ncbi:uncharacterized protein (TIGR00297 family) [Pullulanibacillus pueri]|uniref:DUF92 domain-containing protein n=1 Tax=Pullulanibacillus pueri TaxID=1437324 RepID=A0A8J3ELS7_9BACL|nr:DUF92 domain-containing protein [Pullulanibacillus pueri]MBM7681539.1 uncharacterized protein (TIGR00297 family) [Pullulanibacillus pueri]GGH79754.1 hypothetical protein GCM10007096_15150 [Pullulanibacillus pueri]
MLTFILAMLCLLVVAGLAVSKRWLTVWAAIGMVIMGFFIQCAFAVQGLLVIFVFFISSNLISLINKRAGKKKTSSEQRTLYQVLANGGVPLLAALGGCLWPHPLWIAIYVVSVAEATADTWASEIGSIRGGTPYHLILRRPVPKGLSGAMTWTGSIAALIGSSLIALLSSLMFYSDQGLTLILVSFICLSVLGWLGQFIDTLLGGLLQARYQCAVCHTLTDAKDHCERVSIKVAGVSWMTNNLVNGLSSLLAGCMGSLFFFINLG